MIQKLISALRDRYFIWFLAVSLTVSLLTCLSWGVPLTLRANLLWPLGFSYLMVLVLRAVSSIFDPLFVGSSRSLTPEEARKEAEAGRELNQAANLEHDGRYAEAAEMYEQELRLNPRDIFTRERLAGIYLRRLHKRGKAIEHYGFLAHMRPDGSLLRQEAIESARKMLAELREGR